MRRFKTEQRAFTLIELLIVATIIGVLAVTAVVSYSRAQAQSRDAKRKSDTATIQGALAMYYLDNKKYPDVGSGNGVPVSELGGALAPYVTVVPSDPGSSNYQYVRNSALSVYGLLVSYELAGTCKIISSSDVVYNSWWETIPRCPAN